MHKANEKGHDTHEDILLRLKRAKGHLETVIEMIENDKSCIDVSRQMHAVTKALTTAKRIFIEDHIVHCLDLKALNANELSVKDFKEITKYL